MWSTSGRACIGFDVSNAVYIPQDYVESAIARATAFIGTRATNVAIKINLKHVFDECRFALSKTYLMRVCLYPDSHNDKAKKADICAAYKPMANTSFANPTPNGA